MNYLIYLLLFVLGATWGSFLNVVILREENKKSILGRSYCPHCQKKLSAKDLLPLVSYLALGGRCRYCQKPISIQYPLGELTGGLIFLLVGVKSLFPLSLSSVINTCYLLVLASLLIIIFISDIRYQTIPDISISLGIGTALFYWTLNLAGIVSNFNYYLYGHKILGLGYNLLIAMGVSSLPFFLLYFISQESWLGFGDVKFSLFMAVALGFPKILAALFVAIMIGALTSLILIIRGQATIKDQIPFGPFLALGTFVALLWGDIIIKWYLEMLFW